MSRKQAYKVTTNGRNLLAALMDMGKGLELTRVAVGSGTVDDDTDLADVHELLAYVAEGTLGSRSHEEDRLYLTVRYENNAHKDVPMFYLAEFIIYAKDPENGEDIDLLYGTLGDYRLPMPAYSPAFPACGFSFPLVLILSSDITVSVSAPAGLVTYDELEAEVRRQSVKTVFSALPPKTGPALWFCSDPAWRPTPPEPEEIAATLALGDPDNPGDAAVFASIDGVSFPVKNATHSIDESGIAVVTVKVDTPTP